MKRSKLLVITIGLLAIFFLVVQITRKKEHFEDATTSPALNALKKLSNKFKELSKKLHKQKITVKDDIIQTIQDDIQELDLLYRKKLTTERQVTYETIQTEVEKYVNIFNKIVVDYKVDMLDIKVKDILEQNSYDRPNTTVGVYKSKDSYKGEN